MKESRCVALSQFTISLSKIMKELSLETIYMPSNPDELLVCSPDVNRPGLELHGFFTHFEKDRILIIGNAESAYLEEECDKEKRIEVLEALLSKQPPAVIFCRSLQPVEEFITIAKKYEVPLLSSDEMTCVLLAALISFLNVQLAPRVTRHGVLVEVYGEGILIVGDSGVGKSETAIELIKRGHRLIADDAVEIRRVSAKTLVGSSPKNIRHFIELRGIGIVNARRLFGMGAVKTTEKIDFIINLEVWDDKSEYDRMGIDKEYTEILDIKVPVMTIPVRQGRNLAVIIEVAAMNNREKTMGYNAAKDLMEHMGMEPDIMQPQEKKIDLEI